MTERPKIRRGSLVVVDTGGRNPHIDGRSGTVHRLGEVLHAVAVDGSETVMLIAPEYLHFDLKEPANRIRYGFDERDARDLEELGKCVILLPDAMRRMRCTIGETVHIASRVAGALHPWDAGVSTISEGLRMIVEAPPEICDHRDMLAHYRVQLAP